jgi:hypothetical protein
VKAAKPYLIKTLFCLAFFLCLKTSFGQGKVVINEYLPWTSNGCGATAEFVELMNFGPGPVNIGCYILTDGDYSVTIPPNTILQPGEFYVIAGQDVIPFPCANIDSSIHADLNWNTCGCTSGAIPTTGDGFFTDGGNANEQVVLLDPNKHVVDAVIRDLPAETSSPITTSSVGGCASRTFNLDTMAIDYEILGMSTGRGNSFARKLDGDCGWVKDPQQSGNATNNTPGETSDVAYDFFYVQAMDCSDNHGAISVHVRKSDYTGFFPMYYTIAFDADNNGVFDFNDQYSRLVDSFPPDISISNLPQGKYRLTVESSKGCDLATFDFQILPCISTLPVKLQYFRYKGIKNGQHLIDWLIEDVQQLKTVVLETKTGNSAFVPSKVFSTIQPGGSQYFTASETVSPTATYFRLKLTDKSSAYFYSSTIGTKISSSYSMVTAGPNPVSDKLDIQFSSALEQKLPYSVYDINGRTVLAGSFDLKPGSNSFTIPVANFSHGIYQFLSSGNQPISFRFVKH